MRSDNPSDHRSDQGGFSNTPKEAFSTRDIAIKAIEEARDWSELFDRANQALGRDRQGWGDLLEPSAAAALAWRACGFPVAARETLVFKSGPGVCDMLAGEALLKACFDLAKEVAVHLLADFTAQAHERAKGAWEGASTKDAAPLDQALEGAKKRWLDALWRLRGALQRSEAGEARRSLDEGFLGAHGTLLLDSASAPFLLRHSSAQSWVALGTASQSQAGDVAVFERARAAGGFDVISSGPAGGTLGAARALEKLERAWGPFTKALGQPTSVAGLGGLSLEFNFESDIKAGYMPLVHAMFIPNVDRFNGAELTRSFAHEWTHALERLVVEGGGQEQKAALDALFAAVQSCEADPEEARFARALPFRCEESEETLEMIAFFLQTEGPQERREDAGWRREQALSVAREWDEASRCLPSSQQAPKSAIARCLSSLSERAGPGSRRANAESVAEILAIRLKSRRMEKAFEQTLRRGGNVFLANAARADAEDEGSGKAPYWSNRGELIARVAESFAFDRAAPNGERSTNEGERSSMRPQGSERQALVKAFEVFARRCAPMLRKLIEPSQRSTWRPEEHSGARIRARR